MIDVHGVAGVAGGVGLCINISDDGTAKLWLSHRAPIAGGRRQAIKHDESGAFVVFYGIRYDLCEFMRCEA